MSALGVQGNWDSTKLSPELLEAHTTELISKLKGMYDGVAQLDKSQLTVDNLVKVLADAERQSYTMGVPLTFPRQSASDKDVRDASTQAEKTLDEFDVETSMRQDIFERVHWFSESEDYKTLSDEGRRFIDRLVRNGKRNGLHLPKDSQDKITAIKKKLSELGINFNSNLNEDKSFVAVTRDELKGMPDDFIDSLDKTDEGLYKIEMKYPHYFPVSRNCSVAETRKKCDTLFLSRCRDVNCPILSELMELRTEQAAILNYPTHAHYIQEIRMAKNPDTVRTFLQELKLKLQPLWVKEKEAMLAIKKQECLDAGVSYDGVLNAWDTRYYMTKVEENNFSVDKEKIKQYFPMSTVTEGLLDIYQELLSLKFVEVPDAQVWHPDVKLYKVLDVKTGCVEGYFFLDLYPREGKYGHAAVFPLQPGCLVDVQGTERQPPVCAMLCNFTKPTATKPSLLGHDEVETYFHEFGHVMHMICTEVDYAKFGFEDVERDFIEAPSQMLENWVWEVEPLNRMSKHNQTGEPLPSDMICKLIASRQANAGYKNLRQVLLATYDQKISTEPVSDLTAAFDEVSQEVLGIQPIPGTCMPAHFGHLAGGYDAQYYGYLWSEVFSMDMYDSQFKAAGIMNPEVGHKYKSTILRPGGTHDADVLLRNFLGRDPCSDAFLKSKGIL